MSLTVLSNRKNWGLPETAGHAGRKPAAFPLPAIFRFIRKAALKSARFLVHAHEAFAEARMHKAMIETQLYLNRYKHASKNDDDLPIVGSAPAEQVAPSVSPRVALQRAAGAVVSIARRIFPVIFIFAFFVVAVAATIGLRLAIWLPLYWH